MPASTNTKVEMPEGWSIYKSGILGFVLGYSLHDDDDHDDDYEEICFMNDSGLHFFDNVHPKTIPIACLQLLIRLCDEHYE